MDDRIIEIAVKYFNIGENLNLSIQRTGVKEYLRLVEKSYDVIIADAFIGDRIPKDINTKEFFNLCENHLRSDGVFILNSIVDENDKKEVKDLKRNIKTAFKTHYSASYDENTIYFAFPRNVTQAEVREKLRRRVDPRLKVTVEKVLKTLNVNN